MRSQREREKLEEPKKHLGSKEMIWRKCHGILKVQGSKKRSSVSVSLIGNMNSGNVEF